MSGEVTRAVSDHDFRCELDGVWYVPWCTCGWTGKYEAFRSHAHQQWCEHTKDISEPETGGEQDG